MKYTINLSHKDIEYLRARFDDAQKSLNQMTDELCRRLAEMGLEKARVHFFNVTYDGTNDVNVSMEKRDGGYAVMANGQAVLFIEFGSGLIGFGHPELHGMGPGTYPGKGHWNDPNGWYYAHGKKSHGNPPNMPMYTTVKELEQEMERMVKEVFDLYQ